MENVIAEYLINSTGFVIIWVLVGYKRKEKLSTLEIIIIAVAMAIAGGLISVKL